MFSFFNKQLSNFRRGWHFLFYFILTIHSRYAQNIVISWVLALLPQVGDCLFVYPVLLGPLQYKFRRILSVSVHIYSWGVKSCFYVLQELLPQLVDLNKYFYGIVLFHGSAINTIYIGNFF